MLWLLRSTYSIPRGKVRSPVYMNRQDLLSAEMDRLLGTKNESEVGETVRGESKASLFSSGVHTDPCFAAQWEKNRLSMWLVSGACEEFG